MDQSIDYKRELRKSLIEPGDSGSQSSDLSDCSHGHIDIPN